MSALLEASPISPVSLSVTSTSTVVDLLESKVSDAVCKPFAEQQVTSPLGSPKKRRIGMGPSTLLPLVIAARINDPLPTTPISRRWTF